MKLKWQFLEKRILQLFIFLLPSQLAYHFWPQWSFIFGIRVDYLAPAIYLTDLLLVTLFVVYIIGNYKNIILYLSKVLGNVVAKRNIRSLVDSKSMKYGLLLLLLIFLLVFSNIINSSKWQVSLIKWIEVLQIVLFTFYVARKDKAFKNWVNKPLALSIIFFSLLGIIQFIRNGTIGGFLYYLGERAFSSHTPGIALISIFGRQFMRSYSTFAHPNSFAGYILVALLIFLMMSKGSRSYFKFIVTGFAFLGIIFAASKAVFLSLLVVVIMFSIIKYRKANNLKSFVPSAASRIPSASVRRDEAKLRRRRSSTATEEETPSLRAGGVFIYFIFVSAIIFSLILLLIPNKLIGNYILEGESLIRRVALVQASAEMYSKNIISGVGLNSFIINLPDTSIDKGISWWLQPVHNIYILILVETGILGFLSFVLLIKKVLDRVVNYDNVFLMLALLVVVLTGIVDHYWITLQQNQLLLSLLVGLSLRKI